MVLPLWSHSPGVTAPTVWHPVLLMLDCSCNSFIWIPHVGCTETVSLTSSSILLESLTALVWFKLVALARLVASGTADRKCSMPLKKASKPIWLCYLIGTPWSWELKVMCHSQLAGKHVCLAGKKGCMLRVVFGLWKKAMKLIWCYINYMNLPPPYIYKVYMYIHLTILFYSLPLLFSLVWIQACREQTGPAI